MDPKKRPALKARKRLGPRYKRLCAANSTDAFPYRRTPHLITAFCRAFSA